MKLSMVHDMVRLVLKNIRSVRRLRNFSQEYVAVQMGISQKTYSKIESGMITLTVEYLFVIAEILDIDAMILIRHKDIGILALLT